MNSRIRYRIVGFHTFSKRDPHLPISPLAIWIVNAGFLVLKICFTLPRISRELPRGILVELTYERRLWKSHFALSTLLLSHERLSSMALGNYKNQKLPKKR
jgi:hypothetical protein